MSGRGGQASLLREVHSGWGHLAPIGNRRSALAPMPLVHSVQFAVCGRAALCISLRLPLAPALALVVPGYRQGGQILSASCCTRFVQLSSIFHRIKRKPANDQGRALGGSQLSAGRAAAGSGGPGLPSAPPATPRGFLLAPSRPRRPCPGPGGAAPARARTEAPR